MNHGLRDVLCRIEVLCSIDMSYAVLICPMQDCYVLLRCPITGLVLRGEVPCRIEVFHNELLRTSRLVHLLHKDEPERFQDSIIW